MPADSPCPAPGELKRLLLGELADPQAQPLEAHLSECDRCGATLNALETTDTVVEAIRARASAGADPEVEIVEGLIGRLRGLRRPVAVQGADAGPTPARQAIGEAATQPPTQSFASEADPELCDFLSPPQSPNELGRLGQYGVLRVLGAGGMGVVFLAEDPQLKRHVALKAMKPVLAASESARRRFLREAQATAAIEHDHIVTIHHVGEDRRVPFLVMQLLHGETLEDRLRQAPSLSLAEVLRIGRQIAAGLAAAHKRGLMHRDIKPANIWLEEETGRVKILDFGLARGVDDQSGLTQAGTVAGTPAYMAPEQAAGEPADHRCDLFSLGCVLYRMATGDPPFQGSKLTAMVAVLEATPRPPREINEQMPQGLSDLVIKLLAKLPGERPQSARAVVETLETIERDLVASPAGPADAGQLLPVQLIQQKAPDALSPLPGRLAVVAQSSTRPPPAVDETRRRRLRFALAAVNDALDTFQVPSDRHAHPNDLLQFAKLLEAMAEDGYILILDEFQYFNRKGYEEFCSYLQAGVDRLAARADQVRGGLIALGSIHTEMVVLLEDRTAPLYNRVTDTIDLTHLDIGSILSLLEDHAEPTPQRLLFLWNLFEGVPKFYRDCYEQQVLASERKNLLRRIFFESSSPLRSEAENWFLRELRGRYDVVLKYVARNPGRMHKDLVQAIRAASGTPDTQVGGYLKVLIERFGLIERKLPVFAKPEAKRGRYYVTDNFLRSWLAALAKPVSAIAFRPLEELIEEADQRLADVEGGSLEKLAGRLYEERSRKGLGDFPITYRVQGFWDKAGTEIDLVAVNESTQSIRFGSCKGSSKTLLSDVNNFKGHVERFLKTMPKYQGWTKQYVGISPVLDAEQRAILTGHDVIPQDLNDLTRGLS